MKFFAHALAASAISLASPAAASSDWWLVESKAGGMAFVDITSITRAADIRTAWIHAEEVGGISDTIQYARIRISYDCGERSEQVKNAITYDAKDNELATKEVDAAATFPPPDTQEYDTMVFVCSFEPGVTTDNIGKAIRISPNLEPREFVEAVRTTREDLKRTNSPLLKRKR